MATQHQVGGSLSERAYHLIREKILRAEIPLGGALSRRVLAEEFGMSFLPVADAIQRLESEGMLESKPRVGTRVRIPTPQDVRDRYIIREALETQSARLFCERASDKERAELRKMARGLDEMAQVPSDDPEYRYRFQTTHLQFHMRVAECTGCEPLCTMLEKNQVLVFNWLFDIAAESKMPAQWHLELVEVLIGQDADAAALAMGRHIRTGMQEIQQSIAARFGSSLPPIGRVKRKAAAVAGL